MDRLKKGAFRDKNDDSTALQKGMYAKSDLIMDAETNTRGTGNDY